MTEGHLGWCSLWPAPPPATVSQMPDGLSNGVVQVQARLGQCGGGG
jgi:hypothetical protein